MEYKIGDKVRFVDEEAHKAEPHHFPSVGTVGEVIDFMGGCPFVQWPDGSTCDDDKWFAAHERLELVKED